MPLMENNIYASGNSKATFVKQGGKNEDYIFFSWIDCFFITLKYIRQRELPAYSLSKRI